MTLEDALKEDDASKIPALLKSGININELLGFSILYDSIEIFQNLLSNEIVNPAYVMDNGYSPLTFAVTLGRKGLFRMMLNKDDTLLMSKDGNGNTALETAEKYHRKDISEFIKWDGEYKGGDKIRELATHFLKEDDVKGINMLFDDLKSQGSSDMVADFKNICLKRSLYEDSVEVFLDLLLNKKADPIYVNPNSEAGRNAWTLAAVHGKGGLIRLMLKNKPELLNHQDGSGDTAFFMALYGIHHLIRENRYSRRDLREMVYDNHIRISEYLLQKGIDVTIINDDGKTAMMPAAKMNVLPIMKQILSRIEGEAAKREYVSQPSNHGWTNLMCASQEGSFEAVKFLVENGADLHAKFGEQTAYDVAAFYNHTRISGYLAQKMGMVLK